MLTMRNDVTRNKKQIICKNSTIQGFSGVTLRYGNFFTYKPYPTCGETYLAKCHGQIKPSKHYSGFFILGQITPNHMKYTSEMWIVPETVTEIIPVERMSIHIQNYFIEQEMLQDGDTMASKFNHDHFDYNSLYVKVPMTDAGLRRWLDKKGVWKFQQSGVNFQASYIKYFLEGDKFVRGIAYVVYDNEKSKRSIYLRKEMI